MRATMFIIISCLAVAACDKAGKPAAPGAETTTDQALPPAVSEPVAPEPDPAAPPPASDTMAPAASETKPADAPKP